MKSYSHRGKRAVLLKRLSKSNPSQSLKSNRRSRVRRTDLGLRDRVSKRQLRQKDSIYSLRMKYLNIIRAKRKFFLLAKR